MSNKNSPDKLQSALQSATELSKQADEQVLSQNSEQQDFNEQAQPELTVENTDPSVGAVIETSRPQLDTSKTFEQYDAVSPQAKSLVLQWDAYVTDANPANSQTLASLKLLQTRLATMVTSTFNLESDEDFIVVAGRVMELIRANQNNVFGGDNVMRGFSSLDLSDKRVNQVRFALDALLTFADPKGRKNALRYYNLQQSAGICRTSAGRERLIAYITRISE